MSTIDAKEAKGLQITIMGRSFRVACKEEEQRSLLEAVDYLNRRMEEIRDQGKIVGLERIAIMAALNITHEFLGAKVGGDFDMAAFKRRMAHMKTVIDQAMSEQTKLF
ncbi:MAG: cell division protein ZapA [Betaproteobacteria bacterium]|nr:cell division protein ZapA [Betaproteobacteria bacterium]